MLARKLRHSIVIQDKVEAQDPETGVVSILWQDFANIRASIEPLSAREFIQSDATQAQIVARITIRSLDGLKPSMRVVHKDNVYNIHGVLPDVKSGKHYFTLPCSMGVNNGE